MGASALVGINLVGWPEKLDPALLAEILRGGADTVAAAGAVIAGGHTTTDAEPKYGVAVVGLAHPDRIWTKGGARPGDTLLLTKPIGTGVVTTALKRGRAEAEHLAMAVASMARLSRGAADVLHAFEDAVHAATDVTGFSLAGHGHEMAHASRAALVLDWNAVPMLGGARACAEAGTIPGGGRRNRDFYGPHVRFERELGEADRVLLYDPQTSGGLLVAVDAGRADDIEAAFSRAGEPVWRVGAVEGGPPGGIVVR
jgi:selenide,water dikinase